MSKFCIVYNLEAERNKRQGYRDLKGPELWEAMVNFLEEHPVPINDKSTLEKGVHIFTCVFNTASTPEMKKIAQDYINLFHKEMVTL